MQKNLDAGADSILRTSLRSRNLAWFLLNPEEPRLPAGDVEWLRIGYPATHNFGWIAWFGVISTVGAIFLGKYLPRKRVY